MPSRLEVDKRKDDHEGLAGGQMGHVRVALLGLRRPRLSIQS
jgi:hypothetical protein